MLYEVYFRKAGSDSVESTRCATFKLSVNSMVTRVSVAVKLFFDLTFSDGVPLSAGTQRN